jgi:hypothetical protein
MSFLYGGCIASRFVILLTLLKSHPFTKSDRRVVSIVVPSIWLRAWSGFGHGLHGWKGAIWSAQNLLAKWRMTFDGAVPEPGQGPGACCAQPE